MTDYYSLLGVTPGTSGGDLKKAYRKKAKEFHPDRNKDNPQAEEKFKEINEAYAVLSDKKKRAQYDQFGSEGFHKRFSREDIFRDFDFGDIYGGFASNSPFGGGGNVPDLESFLSGDGFRGSRARKGKDVRQSFYLSFQDATLGTIRTVTFEQNGKKVETSFKVPPGSKDGRRLRLVGKGQAGVNGGPPGDLYLKVRVNAHPLFKREGDDILLDKEICLSDAILGTTVEVPTLTESKMVKIPPGTQSHSKLRLKGMGIPRSRGKEKGDQLVRVIIKYQKDLTETQLDLIHKLKAEGL
ncbi:MAG TPA: DnaJ C-terminal domain-containing protein [Nitrospinaceae bacterium]|jgi:curved DNA-binding protein|nr:DnaJ C-terminal domain-containing protein [Nitrospinaceae bacterium]